MPTPEEERFDRLLNAANNMFTHHFQRAPEARKLEVLEMMRATIREYSIQARMGRECPPGMERCPGGGCMPEGEC